MHSPQDNFIITLIISDRRDWCDTRGKCLWLGTRTGAGGTDTLAESFFGRSPWLQGHDFCNVDVRPEGCGHVSWTESLNELLKYPCYSLWSGWEDIGVKEFTINDSIAPNVNKNKPAPEDGFRGGAETPGVWRIHNLRSFILNIKRHVVMHCTSFFLSVRHARVRCPEGIFK